jgi:hypothetical protein
MVPSDILVDHPLPSEIVLGRSGAQGAVMQCVSTEFGMFQRLVCLFAWLLS